MNDVTEVDDSPQVHLAENYERIVSDPDFMNSHVNEEVARHAPLEMSAGDSVVVRLADESVVSGVVIEDFGPLAGYPVTISEDEVVRSRRWAVETVEIGVVFVDDEQIEHVVPRQADATES